MGDSILGWEIHPLCERVPPMSPEEFSDLVESIRDNGYNKKEPIIIYQGKVLDGRHRLKACAEAGKVPSRAPWSGEYGTPENYVTIKNINRRHLSDTQRKFYAAKYILPEERAKAAERLDEGRKSGGRGRKKLPCRSAGEFSDTGEATEAAARRAGLASGRQLGEVEKILQQDESGETWDYVMSDKKVSVAKAKRHVEERANPDGDKPKKRKNKESYRVTYRGGHLRALREVAELMGDPDDLNAAARAAVKNELERLSAGHPTMVVVK